jgi:hypothetical protein
MAAIMFRGWDAETNNSTDVRVLLFHSLWIATRVLALPRI